MDQPCCEIRRSDIHNQGVFATQDIEEGEVIIEYIGEKISSEEGTRRSNEHAEQAAADEASVFIFELNDEYDIDGNVPENTARLINHSCEPNCEAQIFDEKIWIVALRAIREGEELSFDYGFDLEVCEDHPCYCGSAQCIGVIVSRDHWDELKARRKEKATSA